MKQLDVVFDLETCSKAADAAVVQFAAVACDFTKKENPFLMDSEGNTECINFRFDLWEMFCQKADFDKDTQEWWAKKPKEIQEAIRELPMWTIESGMSNVCEWINAVKESTGAETVLLWAQGSDFDIPKMKNLMAMAGIDEKALPYKFYNVRCARSYCLEELAKLSDKERGEFFAQENKKIYSAIPKLVMPHDLVSHDDGAHDAIYDSANTAWNVWWLMNNKKE